MTNDRPTNVHVDRSWNHGEPRLTVTVWTEDGSAAQEYIEPSEAFAAAVQALLKMTLGEDGG